MIERKQRMRKKIIGILLIFVLVTGSVGCGNSNRKETLILALRAGTYAEVIKQCLPAFEKEYGITCEIFELSENDLRSYVLNDSVLRRGSYDLCMVDGSWVAEYVDEDVLADLGKLGCSIDSDIIPATADICVQDGVTYLMPYYGNVTVMTYNREVAKKLGVTEAKLSTLDGIMSFCRSAKAEGNGGFVYRGDTENNIVVDFLPVLRAFGGWVVDENNRPTVNTPEFASALEFYRELVGTGKACTKEELLTEIEQGTMVAAVGWPGWYSAEKNKKMDYISFPGKVSKDSPSYNSNIYGIWTLGIPDNSPNKELASKLLRYLMDPEVQNGTVANGGVPCRYSCLTDPVNVAADPHLKVICTALENGIYRPVIRDWPKMYTILGGVMKNVLEGSLSVEEGLMLAQAELEEALK